MTFTIFALPSQAEGQLQASFALMNLDFEVVVFLPTYTLANRQNNKNWWGGK